MALIDPRLDPLAQAQAGRISNVDWLGDWKAQQAQNAGASAAANAVQQNQAVNNANILATKAAADAEQKRKDDEVADAMAGREKLKPESARIDKAFKRADAIRQYGQSLNTGSVNGSAPNWAGALAGVTGSLVGDYRDRQAQEDAKTLAGKSSDITKKYFQNMPDYFV